MNSYGHLISANPENEAMRLSKLYQYEILGTPEEESFDKIARLASQIFNTPHAFVVFVDREYIFFKSFIGSITEKDLIRKDSFYSLAIANENKITAIDDIQASPEFSAKPYFLGEKKVRFFAAVALTTLEGFKIGCLGVLDEHPHHATEAQSEMLQTLSEVIMEGLDLRMATKKAVRVHTDLMNIAVHELKNPLSNIGLAAEILNDEISGNELIKEMTALIARNLNSMSKKLNDLLNLSQIENEQFELNMRLFDVTEAIVEIKNNFNMMAIQKNQKIEIEDETPVFIKADRKRIVEVFDNLISNAIKYSYPESDILIKISRTEKNVVIEFKDQGQGLDENDMAKLFTKFAKLSSVPTGKERSNGLGLSIVKILVELHKGKVWASSDGKNKGSSFFVLLPLPVESIAKKS